MKKAFLCACFVFGLCGFSYLDSPEGGLDVRTNSAGWEVKLNGSSSILAYNESVGLELAIDISNILPTSPVCVSNKKVKDVKMSVGIRKLVQKGDSNWSKSFEQTKIAYAGPAGRAERKVYGSTLVKNNLKPQIGSVVDVGRLEFLAPFPCADALNTSMRIFGMMSGNRSVTPLNIEVSPAKE